MTPSTTFHPTLFRSFWLGGFESACQILRSGARLDMLAATQHDRFIADDYRQLPGVGIHTVRDAVRWHRVESTPGRFDFSSVEPYVRAAKRHQIQVVWDLLHYGWPDGLDIFDAAFVTRFARFAGVFARHVRDQSDDIPFYTPINEVSYFAWAAGDLATFHPCERGRADELKRQLVRAWIAAIDAIRDVDPRARFVSAEPLIHVAPPLGQPDVHNIAARRRANQWHAWDMITGAREPELGGAPAYLDVVGVNFYYDNQWEEPDGPSLNWNWDARDPRWTPLSTLLKEAWARYHRQIIIGETSHIGHGRPDWIRDVTDEVAIAVAEGVPVEGICLYPLIDRFEWENPSHWHNSGLWDVMHEPDGTLRRVLNQPYADELKRCQTRLAELGLGNAEALAR